MLTRWSPFVDLIRFDNLFDDLYDRSQFPAVDMREGDDKIYINAELPGMDDSNVKIEVEKNILTVKGERREERTEKGKYYRKEIKSGSFTRSFSLPANIETDKIEATFDKGILRISVPKAPEKVPKLVEIKVKK